MSRVCYLLLVDGCIYRRLVRLSIDKTSEVFGEKWDRISKDSFNSLEPFVFEFELPEGTVTLTLNRLGIVIVSKY